MDKPGCSILLFLLLLAASPGSSAPVRPLKANLKMEENMGRKILKLLVEIKKSLKPTINNVLDEEENNHRLHMNPPAGTQENSEQFDLKMEENMGRKILKLLVEIKKNHRADRKVIIEEIEELNKTSSRATKIGYCLTALSNCTWIVAIGITALFKYIQNKKKNQVTDISNPTIHKGNDAAKANIPENQLLKSTEFDRNP